MASVDIICSKYFQKQIISSHSDFIQKAEEITEVYPEAFFNNILNDIENTTKIKWKKEKYKVYLFEGNYVNISYPICINVSSNCKEDIMFNIVHELVHNNISDLWIFTDKKQLFYDPIEAEAIVNLITSSVLEKYFDKEKLHEVYMNRKGGGGNFSYKYVWKRVFELKKELNLSRDSFLKYIKSSDRLKLENEY